MKRLLPVAAIALVAINLAACDKPRTNSAYNNSGASATPLMPANPPSAATDTPEAAGTVAPAQSAVTTAPATSDTALPSTAPLATEPAKSEAPK